MTDRQRQPIITNYGLASGALAARLHDVQQPYRSLSRPDQNACMLWKYGEKTGYAPCHPSCLAAFSVHSCKSGDRMVIE